MFYAVVASRPADINTYDLHFVIDFYKQRSQTTDATYLAPQHRNANICSHTSPTIFSGNWWTLLFMRSSSARTELHQRGHYLCNVPRNIAITLLFYLMLIVLVVVEKVGGACGVLVTVTGVTGFFVYYKLSLKSFMKILEKSWNVEGCFSGLE